MNLAELIASARLIITAGSGGVGKTTTAAALGLAAAGLGRRVAVLTIDPAKRLAQALGLDALTGHMRRVDPVTLSGVALAGPGELWAQMLDIKVTADGMVDRFAPSPEVAQAILSNRAYAAFSTSLAGSQEYMAVEAVWRLISEGGFDLVVLDTPPAAHALDFLDAPARLLDALDSKGIQRLIYPGGQGMAAERPKPPRGRGLLLRSFNKLTGGAFISELSDFLSLFGCILNALQESSRGLQGLLRQPGVYFTLVTTPAQTQIAEALAFERELSRRGLPLWGFLCNRVHPPLPPEAAAWLEASPGRLDEAGRALTALLRFHQARAALDAQALARLSRAAVEARGLPLLSAETDELTRLAQLGALMTGRGGDT
ncbi:AAA family ATPase [Myxococcota bacterium]|nr:AAA family ATPase [Myxococcota bacterium]MBU1899898.1 AAA family ATPase [Myxococcota bacterium]